MQRFSDIRRLIYSLSFGLLVLPANGVAQNLIVNSDFESGNSGFLSEYEYSPAENSSEAQYTVRTDPYPWNEFFISHSDHTSGAGNMFVGNGDTLAGTKVWESAVPIAVLPNTTYYFEAWAMNVCCNPTHSGANSPAVLEFSVEGAAIESLGTIATSFPAGVWQFLGTTWNSGANTSARLRIINQNTAFGGNDFALDDLHFSTRSSIPEPTTIAILAIHNCWMILVIRRRNRRVPQA